MRITAMASSASLTGCPSIATMTSLARKTDAAGKSRATSLTSAPLPVAASIPSRRSATTSANCFESAIASTLSCRNLEGLIFPRTSLLDRRSMSGSIQARRNS
jgi:hypothetical protein